jgi:hypothetical protein
MIKIIQEVNKEDLKDFIYKIGLEDKNIYKEANNKDKIGIFQINGNTAERLCEEVQPENFDELVAVSAMARPGTLETAAPFYVDRKNGASSDYPDAVKEILKDTHETCIYQEQLMSISQKIGGFSLDEANELRGVMKKLAKADKKEEDLKEWDKIVKKFVKNAAALGIVEKDAKKIANDMAAFAGYSFNKCFSGDCKIDRDNKARWSPTIEEMWLTKNDRKWAYENGHKSLYKKYNREGYGNAYSIINGRLFSNKIVDITFEGERETFRIGLENGKVILVTSNHKFPTKDGMKSIDSGLAVGETLFTVGNYTQEIKYIFSDFTSKNRPFKKYSNEGFLSGKENSGYINGEYIKFINNRNTLLKESNGLCKECNKYFKRLECHHKDGNRKNNEKENLLICCSGCHKKLDYSLGRKRKNEKGLPIEESKIISIDSVGITRTYNVEMKAPNHTVCVNGIAALNSHAVSYTYISAITLYLSYYFKKYFYASVLEHEREKGDNLLDKVNSVRKQGIKILPPDINLSKETFKPEGENIRFGLGDIKFISSKALEVIIPQQPFSDLFDFLFRARDRAVTIKVILALISVGCFDSFSKNRKQLISIAERYWKDKKSNKLKEKLKSIYDEAEKQVKLIPALEDSAEDYVNYEKEYFGFKIFSTQFTDSVIEKLSQAIEKGLIYRNLLDVKSSSKKTAVVINKVKSWTDKNGNNMAFLDVEDSNGNAASFPVFASYWKFLSSYIEDEKLYLLNLYLDKNGKIMFGSPDWTDSEFKIKRLVKRIG